MLRWKAAQNARVWANTLRLFAAFRLVWHPPVTFSMSRIRKQIIGIIVLIGAGTKMIYVPHHLTEEHDYKDWKFKNSVHRGIERLVIFEKGSWGGEFHPELQPREGSLVAGEHWTSSGFANTDLDMLLKQHGIDHVVIAGIRANTCVEATGRYAVELGYHTSLISDAIAAFNWEEMKATIEINFPSFGHGVLTTEQFIAGLDD